MLRTMPNTEASRLEFRISDRQNHVLADALCVYLLRFEH